MKMLMATDWDTDTVMAVAYPVVAALALVVAAVWFKLVGGRSSRLDRLAEWARSRGLDFRYGRCAGMDRKYPWIRCLQQGEHRQVHSIICGPWAKCYSFLGFDYQYTIKDDEGGDRTYTFSMVILGVPLELKPLDIRRKGLFDRLAGLLKSFNVQFGSSRSNRRFHVDCHSDEDWAREMLSPKTIERLLEAPRLTIQMRDSMIALCRPKLFTPRDFEDAAVLAAWMMDRLAKGVATECPLPTLVPQG